MTNRDNVHSCTAVSTKATMHQGQYPFGMTPSVIQYEWLDKLTLEHVQC